MTRLWIVGRLLGVALLTLLARGLIKGFTVDTGVAAGLLSLLLVIATALLRQGRRLQDGVSL